MGGTGLRTRTVLSTAFPDALVGILTGSNAVETLIWDACVASGSFTRCAPKLAPEPGLDLLMKSGFSVCQVEDQTLTGQLGKKCPRRWLAAVPVISHDL